MSKTLAGRLKAARYAMHPPVTQREIAKRFHVTPGAGCLWEGGSTEPSSEVLARLAKLYGVSVDWLVGLTESRVSQVTISPPIHTVPVVSPRSLAEWRLSSVLELLQTSVAYPKGTAAAMLVSSDALTSTCPTGSYAVVSKSHKPTPGCVVLASTGRVSEPILRKYVSEGQDTLLLSDDARWPTVRLGRQAKVIGCVVEVTARRRLM